MLISSKATHFLPNILGGQFNSTRVSIEPLFETAFNTFFILTAKKEKVFQAGYVPCVSLCFRRKLNQVSTKNSNEISGDPMLYSVYPKFCTVDLDSFRLHIRNGTLVAANNPVIST